jgi:hypothetical protein
MDRNRLSRLIAAEETLYAANNPRSLELFQQSSKCLLAGVPMHWMVRSMFFIVICPALLC